MWCSFLHQEGAKLEQEDPEGIRGPMRIFWVNDLADKDRHQVVWTILAGIRRSSDELGDAQRQKIP